MGQITAAAQTPVHQAGIHESSFNSANRKIEMVLPLSSPHRRLQLMIRAPEIFTSTVRVLN